MAQRVLVLTNEILADANEVPEAIRPLLEEAEEICVIAPTLTTWLQWVATDLDGARVLGPTSACRQSSTTCTQAA